MTPGAVLAGEAQWCVVEGDCWGALASFPPGSVDALVTDPPYGIDLGECGNPRGGNYGMKHEGYGFADTYEHFVAEVVPRLNEWLDVSKRALVWTGPHIHEQRKPAAIGGVYFPGAVGRHVWGFKQFLPALLYGMSPTLAQGKGAGVPTCIQSNERAEPIEGGHPVPKPLPWMLWSVRLASLPGELVVDPFAGSGTTGVAALRLGRRVVLIERDPRFAALARERMSAEESTTTVQAMRAGQGALFGNR